MLYPYLDQNVFCLFQSWLRLQQKSSLAWWGSWKAITPTGRDGYNWKHSKCRSSFICWCSNLALQLRAKVSYSIDSDHKEVLHFLEHKNEKNIVAASLYRCPTLKHTFQYSCPCEIPSPWIWGGTLIFHETNKPGMLRVFWGWVRSLAVPALV